MKLNNHGWGLQELLVGLGVLFFCLLLIVSLINRNFKQLQTQLGEQQKKPTNQRPVEKEENYSSYKEIEKAMSSAAKKYNEKIYGQDLQEGDNITVTLKSLIREQYLDKISDIKDDHIICTGYVNFIKENGYVSYSPYLKCDNRYETKGYLERLDTNIE